MNIPKIIHQIWIQGEENLPKKYHTSVQSFKSMIPQGYEYFFWDDSKIKELLEKNNFTCIRDCYNKSQRLEQKADIARYVILYLYGGYYVDVDIKRLRNFTYLEKKNIDIVFLRTPIDLLDRYTLQNSFIGSIKGCTFWEYVIEKMEQSCQTRNGDEDSWFTISESTGSKLLYRISDKYKDEYKIHFLKYPYVSFLFSDTDYLLDKPVNETLFVIQQNLSSSNNNGFFKAAILYSKIRKNRWLLLFLLFLFITVLVILFRCLG